MKALDIDSQPCLIHTAGTPKAVLIQLTARHERKTIDSELSLIEQGSQMGFVFVGIDLQQWALSLMPWADEAVARDPEVGRHAIDTLDYVTRRLLPYIYNRYGQLPCILGGYSLGGLFSLWAASECPLFDAVAAASPSVWVKNWDNYADSHPSMARKAYMSLGDREEHARNQRMAAVGDCIRRHHERLKAQLGSGSTTLAWNKGGHFDHEDQRMADAFLWCLKRIDGDKMDENKR